MKRSLNRFILVGLLLTATGCCNAQRRPAWQSQPVAPPSPRPVLPVTAAPLPPPGTFQAAPPPFPTAPPGTSLPPPAPPTNPFPIVPAPGPPTTSGAILPPNQPIARVENRWQPADNSVQ